MAIFAYMCRKIVKMAGSGVCSEYRKGANTLHRNALVDEVEKQHTLTNINQKINRVK